MFCRAQRFEQDFMSSIELKSYMIGKRIFLLSIFSYVPLAFDLLNIDTLSSFLFLLQHTNNFANFFVYLSLDDEFRNWVVLGNKVLHEHTDPEA